MKLFGFLSSDMTERAFGSQQKALQKKEPSSFKNSSLESSSQEKRTFPSFILTEDQQKAHNIYKLLKELDFEKAERLALEIKDEELKENALDRILFIYSQYFPLNIQWEHRIESSNEPPFAKGENLVFESKNLKERTTLL